MDKQKQLNEMHQILLSAGYDWWKTAPNGKTKSEYEAECFYNAGYRKIPENAVFILEEEMEQFAELFAKSPQIQKVMDGLIKAWQKETAEEFAERLKEKLEENSPIAGYDLEDLEFDGETIQECINETYNEIIKGEIQ